MVDGKFVQWSIANVTWLNWERNNLFRYFDFQRNAYLLDYDLNIDHNKYFSLGFCYASETYGFNNAHADTTINLSPGKMWSPEFKSYGIKYLKLKLGMGFKKDMEKGFLLWNSCLTSQFTLEQFANYDWPIDYHDFPNKISHIGFESNLNWFVKIKSKFYLKTYVGIQLPQIILNKNISRENVTSFTLNLGIGYAFGWDKKSKD